MNILTQTITALFQQEIELNEPFINFSMRFSHIPGTVCLMSGTDLDCARYHMLATRPFLTLSGKGRSMTIRTENRTEKVKANPFDILGQVLTHFRNPDITFPEPVSAGLFGYLAYDLKDQIETLPKTTMDDLDLPDLYMSAPSLIVVQDKQENRTRVYIPEQGHTGQSGVTQALEFLNRIHTAPLPSDEGFAGNKDLHSNFDKASYMACIDKIREYITAGDIYQVNMSQRFDTQFTGSPASLFKTLYRKNPAPFFAFVNGCDHWVISTSPERFIKRTGNFVETRPIKGTCPRGATADQDQINRDQLAKSRKDDAELSMIVDLMRNDLGKVSVGGSVLVAEHKRLEAYANVHHLISIVRSTLDPAADSVDLIRATFPGGSITGCPKIRAMEIIDELETHRRHVYTGSIGYISFHDTLDLSIAIRTAVIRNGHLVFSVGGGVVFDSDPAGEYSETLDKGKTLMEAMTGSPAPQTRTPMTWVNGRLTPANEVSVPLWDLGVQYGHGFFETLRVDNGCIGFLADHIRRLEQAWTRFFPQPFPDLSWDSIITMVIDACGLSRTTAAVKIMATRGSHSKAPWDHQVIVTARPYTHRLKAADKDGLDIVTFDQPRFSPMADYKSLNYQFYYLAGQRAKQLGADECLILNPDGSVSEGNTVNFLFVNGRELVVPASPHRLSGIMEVQIKRRLTARGYTVTERCVFPDQMAQFDQVIAGNSLMGAVPVKSLDGRALNMDASLIATMNEAPGLSFG